MILQAQTWNDLEWDLSALKEGELVQFDFGWGKGPFLVNDPAAFHAYALAVEKFAQKVKNDLILFQGSLDVLSTLVVADGELVPLEAAHVFGSYLHRLASFLPDEREVYCLFTDFGRFTKGEAAQLLSQERFAHIRLSTEEPSALGVLLPPDELMTDSIINILSGLLEEFSLRVIPEKKLNEMWDGLDELIYFEEALSSQGQRQLMGFQAAGGMIRSRGIRTPDPLLPKQMR